MNKTPLIIITGLLVLIAGLSVFTISKSGNFSLSDAELVNFYVAVAACLGAFVSATFVVFSYLRTNAAYIESKRPHLLIQIHNLQMSKNESPGVLIPMTNIHYQNITNNRFTDLSIEVIVTAANRTIELNDLFRQKMVMIGQDSRARMFNPIQEFSNRGFNLQETATSGNEVVLSLNYSYTFGGKRDHVEAQKYRWDTNSEEWHIC